MLPEMEPCRRYNQVDYPRWIKCRVAVAHRLSLNLFVSIHLSAIAQYLHWQGVAVETLALVDRLAEALQLLRPAC